MLGPLKSCNKSGFIVFIVIYSTISCIRTCMWRAYFVDICRDSKKWVDDLGQGQCTSHLSVGPRCCRSLNIILKDWTIFVTTEIVFGSCPSQSFVSAAFSSLAVNGGPYAIHPMHHGLACKPRAQHSAPGIT